MSPRAARPQRQRHRPGRRVLRQAVRHRPAKVRPGYANFAIADPPLKLVLLENPGQGGSLNHLGVEVADTSAVDAEQARLAAAGLASADERDTTCCYARQDKFWVQGAPDGEGWEIYTVLADSQTFYDHDHGSPGLLRRGRRPRRRAGRVHCCVLLNPGQAPGPAGNRRALSGHRSTHHRPVPSCAPNMLPV